MKALSLWQPWASAIAVGAKRIETRAWRTNYRGTLAIHAAKRCVQKDLAAQLSLRHFAAVFGQEWPALPFGAIVAICDLVDVREVEFVGTLALHAQRFGVGPGWWIEKELGEYGFGRWAWMLENVRPLTVPLPWKGAQGFFDVPQQAIWPRVAKEARA